MVKDDICGCHVFPKKSQLELKALWMAKLGLDQNENILIKIGVPSKKNIPLPDNLGSRFSVYNLILTQIDEIRKNNTNRGALDN